MRSLFAQLAAAFAAIIAGMALIIAITFYGGAQVSFQNWRVGRGEDIRTQVGAALQALLAVDPSPTGYQVEAALAPMIGAEAVIVVYDRLGRLLLASRAGRSLSVGRDVPGMPGPPAGMGRPMREPDDIHQDEPANVVRTINPRTAPASGLTPVTPDGADSPALFYRAESLGFLDDVVNRALFRRMTGALLGGVVLSGLIGVVFALATSRRVGRRTHELAHALTDLADGRRDLVFAGTGPRELQSIAEGADDLQRRLAHDELARTQWTQDVAHDLRTPISALRAQIEAMLDGVVAADMKHLQRMLGELDRMQTLVVDLGRLSRLESPDFRPASSSVDAEAFLSDVRSRFELQAAESGKPLTTTTAIERFSGDRELLLRAVSNLVDNAIKYGEPGPVALAIGTATDAVVLTVTNRGGPPGRPSEEDLERLFDRLHRGEYARATGGSGLGLTIVRTIAHVHGGTALLRVEHGDNGSTTIAQVSIPRR